MIRKYRQYYAYFVHEHWMARLKSTMTLLYKVVYNMVPHHNEFIQTMKLLKIYKSLWSNNLRDDSNYQSSEVIK